MMNPRAPSPCKVGGLEPPAHRPVLSVSLLLMWAAASASMLAEPAARLRYPTAMVWVMPEKIIATANSRSATISLVDVSADKVLAEFEMGGRLTDVARIPKSDWYALSNNAEDKIHILKILKDGILDQWNLSVAHDPVQLTVDADGRRLAVASRWSRRVSLFSIHQEKERIGRWIEPNAIIDMPFTPGKMSFDDRNRLFVADRFSGRLAAIDVENSMILKVQEYPMNNIGDIEISRAADMDGIWITGEALNPSATTFQTEVMWGVLMGNRLRRIDWAAFNPQSAAPPPYDSIYSLGDETGPGGDPGDMAVTSDGSILIALGGVDRIAVKRARARTEIARIQVGDRPTALLLSSDEKTVYVANQFSDSISVVDLQSQEHIREIKLGIQPALNEEEKGERHFYDASLSLRGWFSCHSCHTDGHTTGLLNDNLGDDSFGAPKKIPSLLAIEGTEPMSWLGKTATIEGQVEKSLEKTLLSSQHDASIIAQIAAFLRTLKPPTPILKSTGTLETKKWKQGHKVFVGQNCTQCHTEPHYTSAKTYDIGLEDQLGNSKFNPPSLVGVSQRQSFFHDNRATSLNEVFSKHKHPHGDGVPDHDLDDLVYFLQSL